MIVMRRQTVTLVVLSSLLIHTGGKEAITQQEKVKQPPVNEPLRVVVEKRVAPDMLSLVPPRILAPSVHVMRDGIIFRGDTMFTNGTISSATDSIVTFMPGNSPPISLGFALPRNMKLASRSNTKGALTLRNNSGLFGADELVSLVGGNQLHSGYIWQVSPRPIQYEPIKGLILSQEPITHRPSDDSMQPVSVFATTMQKKPRPVAVGKVDTISFQGTKYDVFVHTTLYYSVPEGSDDARTGYVLRAIIVAK